MKVRNTHTISLEIRKCPKKLNIGEVPQYDMTWHDWCFMGTKKELMEQISEIIDNMEES